MIKRTLVTLFSIYVLVSFVFRNITNIPDYKDNVLFFAVFILPYVLMNIVACYFLVTSMFKKPKEMNDNIWTVIVSFLGCNLTFITGHFVQLETSNPNMTIGFIGIILSLMVIPFYIVAVINLGKNLTVLPEANKLNTKGIYSFSRHPLYSCYIFWYFANILIFQSTVIIITTILQSAFQVMRAKNEEKILEKNFPEYAEYKKKVWWIGKIKTETV